MQADTLDRPTWNRTKIFGSKGRTSQGTGGAVEERGRTGAHAATPAREGHTTPDTTRRRGRPPRLLALEDNGLLRIDRSSVYAQILLSLSQDYNAPTKAERITAALSDRWTSPHVFNALAYLVRLGFVERVEFGHYVRRWAPLPVAN